MDIHHALLSIGLLVVSAKLAEGLLRHVGLNSIVAYTAAGALLGPVTGIVESTDDIRIFLNIGVFMLFFVIGLDEIDLPGFMATIRGRYFVAATLSVVISVFTSMIVTSDLFGVGFSLNLEFDKALALAGILSLSSLGVVAKVLSDRGILKELLGLRIFTAVIVAELIALLLIGTTIGELDHARSVTGVLRLLGEIAVFATATWIIAAKVLPRAIDLLEGLLKVPELWFGLLMGSLLLVVAGAEVFGLHGSLGALLFGASLSGLPNRIRRDIMPGMLSAAEGLFVPLFFAAVGLRLDFSFTALPLQTAAALTLVPLVGKLAGAFIGTHVARLETPSVLATSLMAKGVAEIALLLVLLETGVIADEVFSLLVFVMFGYILLTPPAIGLAISRATEPASATAQMTVPPSFARHALEGITVNSVMDRTRTYPGSALSVMDFVDKRVVSHQPDYVVVDGGAPVGIVSLGRLRRLARGSWPSTPLRDVMHRNIPRARPDEPIDEVLERMTDHSLTVIPVMERGTDRFLGSVTSQDVLDLVVLMHQIDGEVQRQRDDTPAG